MTRGIWWRRKRRAVLVPGEPEWAREFAKVMIIDVDEQSRPRKRAIMLRPGSDLTVDFRHTRPPGSVVVSPSDCAVVIEGGA